MAKFITWRTIGRATQEIKSGDYVHVHNVESERGRGDCANIKQVEMI